MKKTKLRRITVLAGAALVLIGLVFSIGVGSFSSFGWQDIALICPLGSLESLVASRTFVPRALLALAVVVLLVVLLGRFFCSWLCPVPPLRRFLVGKKRLQREADERERLYTQSAPAVSGKTRAFDSRHVVLGAALASSLVFGFPVFCLICPVGLTLGLIVALWFMFTAAEVNLSLLVIFGVLVIELLVLRRWCSWFCPMGALLSLVSRGNRTFRPAVDRSVCLRAQGASCHACATVCEEGIDPHRDEMLHDCTKCGICQENCPAGAISFPFLRRPQRQDCPEEQTTVRTSYDDGLTEKA